MRENTRESSPAAGGVLVGAAILLALVYAMGYGHQFADMMSAAAVRGDDWLSGAWDAARAAFAALR